jgi:hypothetical protein
VNSKPATRYLFATCTPDVPLDPATVRTGVKINGLFYNRIALARMRYKRVTLVTDGGKHGGLTLNPALDSRSTRSVARSTNT